MTTASNRTRWIRRAALAAVMIWTSAARADEYRAFWVDAWGAGFLNQSQVDNLLGVPGNASSKGQIRNANCNAVFVQVRRRADVCYPSGMGEPYFSGLSPSNFNALQAMINAAHDTTGGKQRIEVHAWIVTFATASGSSISPVYYQHNNPADPANYWVTLDDAGQETDDKAFDPGHPGCLQYIHDVCMDLVQNFDIDGLHYDYIRFTGYNQGYNPTSIARFNTRHGLTGQPSPTSELFKQWRRDQITALVRKVYAGTQAVKPHVKVSGALVTWNPSPTASTRAAFQATRPYYDVYCDWDAWMQEGILDIAVPMTYYNWASLPADYVRWMNFEKDRRFSRFMVIGPGIYLNSLTNAIHEILLTRDPSPSGNYAQGFCGYSYRVPYSGGTWSSFSPQLVAQVTPTPVAIPVMPWKTSPTKGHIKGTVTYHPGTTPADHAVVSLTGPETRSMVVDGTGFYAFIDLTPGTYTVTASRPGYADAVGTVNVALGQVTGNMFTRNLALGSTAPPAIFNLQATNVTQNTATITWDTDQASTSQVEYGTTPAYGLSTPVDPAPVTAHTVSLTGLTPATLYHCRARSTSANGTGTSEDFTFSTDGPPVISGVQVAQVTASSATITWTTGARADSMVRYGTTPAYGSQTPVDPALVQNHTVVVTGLSPATLYHFQAVSANGYGSDESADGTFTTLDMASEILIDNTDPGWTDTSVPPSTWSVGNNALVPRIGSNYLFGYGVSGTLESDATRLCRWTPDIPEWGLYDVYVYYQIGSNRTSAAPYKVVYHGGEATSIQNQYSATPNQGGWFLVGQDLLFAPGTGGYVQVSNNTGQTDRYVSADAARFVYKGPEPSPPTTPVVTDDGTLSVRRSALHAAWSAEDPESGIRNYEYRLLEQGGAVIRDWTDAGPATSVDATGLPLVLGRTYVFEVRATNHVGTVGGVGASDGIAVFTYDINDDGRVNGADFEAFQGCLSGAGVPFPAGGPVECDRFDEDIDGDVDQRDFGPFQRCLSGMELYDPGCAS